MDVAETLAHIEQNLAGDLSLGALAQRSGCSEYQLHREFRARIGEPPTRYVRRLRLERAAAWLKHASCPVTEIALSAGYGTHEAFTRAFRAHFGVSPQRFRAAFAGRVLPAGLSLRIVRRPARRIAFVRHVGPYDATASAFERLAAWAAARGLRCESMLAVYLDDQDVTPPERTRCDVALFVDDGFRGEGGVGVRELAGGEFGVFHHAGEALERRRLYEAAHRVWLPALGRRPSGAPPFEVYAHSAEGVDQAATDVHLPLRPR